MRDLQAPTITGTVVKNRRLVLKASDKEFFVNLSGSYQGQSSDGRRFVMSVSQARGDVAISGWIIQEHHYKEVMPLNSEMWLFAGKLDAETLQARGTVQRMSGVGQLLGKVHCVVRVTQNVVQFELLGLRDVISFEANNVVMCKPAFREKVVSE